MARKQNNKRLELESLEGRELPTVSLAPALVVPVKQPVIVAVQPASPTLAPAAVQEQQITSAPKVLPTASVPALAATTDALWVNFDAKFSGLRINHNQTIVRIGRRKRGGKR